MSKVGWYEDEITSEGKAWIDSRPPAVRAAIMAYPPHMLYRLRHHIVELYSYEENEDGTCTTCKVLVLQKNNPGSVILAERTVFGVQLHDLENTGMYRPGFNKQSVEVKS